MSKPFHYIHIHIYSTKISHINKPLNFIYTVVPPYPLIQYPRFTAARKKNRKLNDRFVSFKTRAKRERTLTWSNLTAQTYPVLDSASSAPYSRFPTELATILLQAFSLFAVVAALSLCLCSENPYLSIKLYRIYVRYTNIMLCIAFGIIRDFT
jgi:hypothetical protein